MAKSKSGSEAAYRARKLEQQAQAQETRQKQRSQRRIAVAVAVGVLIAGAVALPAFLRTPKLTKQAREAAKRPLADFGVKAVEAGCTPAVTEKVADNWTKHIRGTWTYEAAPPAGGPHSASTISMGSDRFYTREEQPTAEKAVHDLEHGLVVAWYDAALPEVEVEALRAAAASAGDKKLRFVAVPWDRGPFAQDGHLVLTAWGVTQRCQRVSGEAIASFVTDHADAPGLLERKLPV